MATRSTRTRSSYHHGDLRAALVGAGAELARTGGPEAIVLREVTRIVGVAPNAVYTHFGTLAELKSAVAQHALRAMAAAMLSHLAQVDEPADAREAAEVHLREVGRAYVHFALDQPGLFRIAMDGNPDGVGTPGLGEKQSDSASEDHPKPDTLLIAALRRLTEAGLLPAEETDAAVMASWATVHGLATILLNLQPSRSVAEREAAVDAGLHYLLQGLTSRA